MEKEKNIWKPGDWFEEDFLEFRQKGTKIVTKPWGMEVWLREPTSEQQQTGRGYCYKRLFINEGTQTSLQSHVEKSETNYIISGEAEIWLQDPRGETILRLDGGEYRFSVKKMGKNNFYNVDPPAIHRVKSLTNLVLQEASTPQVDDVIRYQDDNGRGSGRINSEHLNLK